MAAYLPHNPNPLTQPAAMKTRYTPVIGHDFIDANGSRCFCLQLCSHGNDGFRTRAFVTLDAGKPDSIGIGPSFPGTRNGLVRMARLYQSRSLPVVFHRHE